MCPIQKVTSLTYSLWAQLGRAAPRPLLPWGWGWVELAVFVVVFAGVVALVWIGLRALGIRPPEWAVQALWVVGIVFAIVLLIRVIASL